MKFGYIKAAAVSPDVTVADCDGNAEKIISMMQKLYKAGVRIAVFPELAVCGYTCSDLFLQDTLTNGCENALTRIISATNELRMLTFIGVPVARFGGIFNCAAAICKGRLLGLVPKTYLPNYGEFYELRQFTKAPYELRSCNFAGMRDVPFGTDIIFRSDTMPELAVAAEICEDLWAPEPPSVRHAMAGANVIVNLSASNELIGKAEYRRGLVSSQSARLLCGYVYSDAGMGESTTDMVFAAHDLIAENGAILADSAPFGSGAAISEIDVSYLLHERRRSNTFCERNSGGYISAEADIAYTDTKLSRNFPRYPFVPDDRGDRAKRCGLILSMQAYGLAKRLAHTKAKKAVVGISGGLDSCLALIVSVKAMELLKRPAADVLAVTMPCFGTTNRTRGNAESLSKLLGASFECVDITRSVRSHFADIGQDESEHDVTFENAQARGRTYILMDIANSEGGLVVGTGDLSELALGWATYNGDHMSMYAVNASVPKTLVRHIIGTFAEETDSAALAEVLRDILDTPVSPELLPAEDGKMTQITEDIVGPYELHDFILFYSIRRGFGPKKVFAIMKTAFGDAYDDETMLHWLGNFYERFFSQQFKRSCLPDGPKLGSTALSPRGDWRMPSDASAALWLHEVRDISTDKNAGRSDKKR